MNTLLIILAIIFLSFIIVLCLLNVQVVGIMRVNVERVLERDAKLSELDDRAGKTMSHSQKA